MKPLLINREEDLVWLSKIDSKVGKFGVLKNIFVH